MDYSAGCAYNLLHCDVQNERCHVAEERARRRLAAILAADVVGYSGLMQADEAGTLAALKNRRKNVLEPTVAGHRGRIVKLMGDGVLIEFGSAVDAVECAIVLQEAMEAANVDLPKDGRIVLRVGINLGDVIVEGTDLYGDGVNIAARIEGLAEPGGVFVSQTVFNHVRGKVQVGFDDLGEKSLKNMSEPVRVYRVAGTPTRAIGTTRNNGNLPSKPSIAVLPFIDMSAGQDQQYLSDGITEDIITELSRYRELFVIARNSSFQYRDKALDVKQIGRGLGVEYVLEGSVRKAGRRIRVTAQLVEASTANHIWAERYDRELDDIFAVQDEVTQTIVATLAGRLAASSAEKTRRKPTAQWASYDYFLQGREFALVRYDVGKAIPLLLRAIELDAAFAEAYAVLAFADVLKFFDDGRNDTLQEALLAAQKALSLDDNDPWSHLSMGFVCTFLRKFDLAGVHHQRAFDLSPNDARIRFLHAHWLTRVGRTGEALQNLDTALRLDPFMPDIYWEARAIAFMQMRQHRDVIDSTNRMNKLQAGNHYFLASAHAHLGQIDEAHAHAAKVLEMKPDYSEKWVCGGEPYQNITDIEHLLEGLRMAGLPRR
jgi:TolB-like protein